MATTEGKRLGHQMSIEELVNDYVHTEEQYQEWKARRERAKEIMHEKLQQDDRAQEENTIHQESGENLKQLTLDLGRYTVVSKEKVSKRFDKNVFFDRLAIEKNNMESYISRFEPTSEEELMEEEKESLIERVRRLEREKEQVRLDQLRSVENYINQATKFDKKKEVEPKYQTVKKKG